MLVFLSSLSDILKWYSHRQYTYWIGSQQSSWKTKSNLFLFFFFSFTAFKIQINIPFIWLCLFYKAICGRTIQFCFLFFCFILVTEIQSSARYWDWSYNPSYAIELFCVFGQYRNILVNVSPMHLYMFERFSVFYLRRYVNDKNVKFIELHYCFIYLMIIMNVIWSCNALKCPIS